MRIPVIGTGHPEKTSACEMAYCHGKLYLSLTQEAFRFLSESDIPNLTRPADTYGNILGLRASFSVPKSQHDRLGFGSVFIPDYKMPYSSGREKNSFTWSYQIAPSTESLQNVISTLANISDALRSYGSSRPVHLPGMHAAPIISKTGRDSPYAYGVAFPAAVGTFWSGSPDTYSRHESPANAMREVLDLLGRTSEMTTECIEADSQEGLVRIRCPDGKGTFLERAVSRTPSCYVLLFPKGHPSIRQYIVLLCGAAEIFRIARDAISR
ncbi:MAG TPA: hypothetical protein VN420_02445 [Candidatus Fimivivens sp.]|nr:hypothetical protein [Candidatus Fimivivens sp.]